MSFFKELKRRNVVRVGIAYVVASWILLQMTDVFVELLDLSNDVGRIAILVLAVGFIPALIFAWAFELTPEGVKREKDVDRTQSITSRTGRKLDFAIIGLLAVGLVYFIWESRFQDRQTGTADEVTASAEPAVQDATNTGEAIERQSVAVLPFTNRSRNTEDEPFVEGVHDDLLTNLARIGGLKVISRTSVLRYKDTEKPIPEIADELGVATVMEGAVQRSGNTVRINVQLIDANTDEHLWAEIFDRELTAENLFAIQSEISQKIAAALETTLTDAEQDRINRMPTDNLDAYDAYVRGRQLMATRNSARLEQATEAFKEAVELDPEFALAWVGVADSHDLLENYGIFDWNEAMEIRENAVNTALDLDPNLGEAYTSLAQVLKDRDKYDEAEDAYRKSIELSPNYATAYHWYSLMITRYALRTQEAADLARKAHELDPRSPIIGVNLAGTYWRQGLLSRTERQLLQVLDLEPDFPSAVASLAGLYRDMGRFDQSLSYHRKSAEIDPGNPDHLHSQAFIYLNIGETEKAEELLARLEEMDAERIGNGFVAMWANIVRGNMAGAKEAANWIVPRMEMVGGGYYFLGFLQIVEGDAEAARANFVKSDPRWGEPEQWSALIEEYEDLVCAFSWTLLATGEQEPGERLLTETTEYLTERLPAATEHADDFNIEYCHLIAGNTEAALAVLQTRMDHNHLGLNWHADTELPWFEPIRHNERYNALLAEHDRRIAEQRELVLKMDEGLAL